MGRCERCGAGGLDEDETHCQPCIDEFEFWEDVLTEAAEK